MSNPVTVAAVLSNLVEALRTGLPELLEVETLKGQLGPEELKGRLAKLPAAYVTLAGMKLEESRYANEDGPVSLTLVAFLAAPARKDSLEPVDLLHKMVSLVGTTDAAYAGTGAKITFDRAENLGGTDAGRDWIYLYALRWSVTRWLAPQ